MAVPAVPGYSRRIREICDRHDVLLILDEVMCGTGRTGTMFACEQDGVVRDLLTMAKGLGAGYQPIGAVMVGAHLFDAFRDGSGFFQHGHPYMAHPTACAAALAVLDAIKDQNLLANVRDRGAELQSALEDRFGYHPISAISAGGSLSSGSRSSKTGIQRSRSLLKKGSLPASRRTR